MVTAISVLDTERNKKNVSRENLTNGICSQQLLYKAVQDSTEIDMLTFEILLERLGRSADDLEYILSESEYDEITRRDLIEYKILSGDIIGAKAELAKYEENLGAATPVMRMYYYRARAYILIRSTKGDDGIIEAKEWIIKAIKETLPGINKSNYRDYLLSTYEIENILVYIKCLCLQGKTSEATSLLEEGYAYFKQVVTDKTLLARILPKAVYLMISYCGNEISYDRLCEYAEEGIDCLRNEGVLYLMEPLLNSAVGMYKNHQNTERASYWSQYCDLIHNLYVDYGCELVQDSLLFRWKASSYHLDCEVIKAERMSREMSQEELAYDIYSSAASISRVENGKVSPNKRTYRKIMERLSVDKPRCGGFVLTTSFDTLEKIGNIREISSHGQFQEALALIEELENDLKEDSYIVAPYKYQVLSALGKIDKSSMRIKALEMLKSRYPIERDMYLRKPFLYEVDLIAMLMQSLSKDEVKLKEDIVYKLKKAYEYSKVDALYNYRGYTSMVSIALIMVEPYIQKPIDDDLLDGLIKYCLSCGKGTALTGAFFGEGKKEKYDNLKDKRLQLVYNSYIFAELYKYENAKYKKDCYERILES